MHKQGNLNFIGIVEHAGEAEARVRIFPEYCEGLKEINRFSHLIILYWIHLRDKKEERSTLQVFPKRHAAKIKVGVFACRSPSRPNPIGLCVVELVKTDACNLTVKGLDSMEGSPIIDIKPYIPRADSVPDARVPEWTLKGPSTLLARANETDHKQQNSLQTNSHTQARTGTHAKQLQLPC